MKTKLLFATASLISFFSLSVYADSTSDARLLIDQAKNSAITTSNVDMAAQKISEEAIKLGKTHILPLQVRAQSCVDEVNKLSNNAQTDLNKAIAKQYQVVGQIDGNKVMLILSSAAKITSIGLSMSNTCQSGPKGALIGYTTAYILNQALYIGNVQFS